MNIIKKILTILIVIFVAIVLLLGILIITKPYGIDIIKIIPAIMNEEPKSTFDHPYLNSQQESILEAAGVDLEKIPTQITAEQ